MSDAPIGEWHGVTTDANGRVTELRLSRNWLYGEIPTELGTLINLAILDFNDNRLSGGIPTGLSKLSEPDSSQSQFEPSERRDTN